MAVESAKTRKDRRGKCQGRNRRTTIQGWKTTKRRRPTAAGGHGPMDASDRRVVSPTRVVNGVGHTIAIVDTRTLTAVDRHEYVSQRPPQSGKAEKKSVSHSRVTYRDTCWRRAQMCRKTCTAIGTGTVSAERTDARKQTHTNRHTDARTHSHTETTATRKLRTTQLYASRPFPVVGWLHMTTHGRGTGGRATVRRPPPRGYGRAGCLGPVKRVSKVPERVTGKFKVHGYGPSGRGPVRRAATVFPKDGKNVKKKIVRTVWPRFARHGSRRPTMGRTTLQYYRGLAAARDDRRRREIDAYGQIPAGPWRPSVRNVGNRNVINTCALYRATRQKIFVIVNFDDVSTIAVRFVLVVERTTITIVYQRRSKWYPPMPYDACRMVYSSGASPRVTPRIPVGVPGNGDATDFARKHGNWYATTICVSIFCFFILMSYCKLFSSTIT